MKEKRFQILSLALNVVLLIALFVTRAELVNTRTILKSNLDGIAYRLSDMDHEPVREAAGADGGSVGFFL